jgi:cation diffusion facilitator CzcD-associated flavoprotein CzcO
MQGAEHVDVVVVGAGLSGIGAGYRLQTECPDRPYVILEGRGAIGGTWDLFRYPGVRSDSDMFTLGYSFEPWHGDDAIADGPSILRYVRETAAKHRIDERIRFHTRVVAADWSTREARWTLTLDTPDGPTTMTCAFLYWCAGYYDYEHPYDPGFSGTETFRGRIVHPQFWPDDLDYAGKRVLVIGSGATAVTLVPAMAEAAAHVTMLQRTPTWISAIPARDRIADGVRSHLPSRAAHRLVRAKNIAFTTAFYQFCQRRPAQARRLLLRMAAKSLGDEQLVAEQFTPPYDPWDQRLCIVPDADFFTAVRRGAASVVTGQVDAFVPEGVRLTTGEVLEADIVVTATGLRLRTFGGVTPRVDGVATDLPRQFIWRGAMVTGLPNLATCIGYTNASWTLRADLTHRLVCRVLNHLRRRSLAAVVPVADADLHERPLLDLSSGYVQRSIGSLPKQGDRGVWRVRQNYLLDSAATRRTNLDRTLHGIPMSAVSRGSPERARA